jgi:hypothetical protein
VHVVADVLCRVAERRGHQVLIGGSGGSPLFQEMNIRPMDWTSGGEADLHVSGAPGPGHRLVVPTATEPADEVDPPALRLAMLRTHYRDPLHIGPADERLRTWRNLVAEWADSPGRPICADYAAEADAAFDDDLDTPAVVSVMDRLAADPEIPPGSKFETFVHLDLILALDLVSAIGRPR